MYLLQHFLGFAAALPQAVETLVGMNHVDGSTGGAIEMIQFVVEPVEIVQLDVVGLDVGDDDRSVDRIRGAPGRQGRQIWGQRPGSRNQSARAGGQESPPVEQELPPAAWSSRQVTTFFRHGGSGRGGGPGYRPRRRGISRQAAFPLGRRPRSTPWPALVWEPITGRSTGSKVSAYRSWAQKPAGDRRKANKLVSLLQNSDLHLASHGFPPGSAGVPPAFL